MSGNVNSVRNSNFRRWRGQPTGWTWNATDARITWSPVPPGDGDADSCLTMTSETDRGEGFWSQTVVVKPKQYYRVEALVRGDLHARDEWSGLVLSVQPGAVKRMSKRSVSTFVALSDPRSTPPVHRATSPVLVRAYFHAGSDVRRLRVSIGIRDARGRAFLHDVRVIEIIEPDEQSHILAMPPPVYATPAPRVAERVCVCSRHAEHRPFTRILRQALGDRQVIGAAPDDLARVVDDDADAIFLPDDDPPKGVRSLKRLLALSEEKIIVVSLSAFAAIAGSAVRVRRVDQPDDPTFARVVYANHATRGFALHDIFAFGRSGRKPYAFAQNQFRRSKAFEAFRRRHGFVTLLDSMCNRDATSEQPLCLYRAAVGGGLYVMDLEAAEQVPSTFNEPALAMQIVLNLLGRSSTGLGQYVVACAKGETLRESVREMSARIDEWTVDDDDVPSAEVAQQLVLLGREDRSFGLPVRPKPLILVRSGLRPGDADSVYAAFIWFKQLVARPPHECPYARALGRRFRLAWLPFSTPWESRDGWSRSRESPDDTPELDIAADGDLVEGVVDLVSRTDQGIRVVIPRHDGSYGSIAHWIPLLTSALRVTEQFSYCPEEGGSVLDRDAYDWRWSAARVEVVVEPSLMRQPCYRNLERTARHLIRIEVPAFEGDFAARSIHRTQVAATLLELVVGLMYGVIAVNRQPFPVQLDGLAPIAPGQAVVVDHDDPMLRERRLEVG